MTRLRRPQQLQRFSTQGERIEDAAPTELHDPPTGRITISPPKSSSNVDLMTAMREMAEKVTAESDKNFAARRQIETTADMSRDVKELLRTMQQSNAALSTSNQEMRDRHSSLEDTIKLVLRATTGVRDGIRAVNILVEKIDKQTEEHETKITAIQVQSAAVDTRVAMLEKVALVESSEAAGAEKLMVRQTNIAKLLWSVVVTLFGIASYLAGKLIK